MRPGPRLLRGLAALAAASLLIPLLPELRWAALAGAVALAGLALAEALRLRRVKVRVEEPALRVLSLDEEEELRFRITSDAPRPLRVSARRPWPRLLGGGSAQAEGVVRPGEVLELACAARGVERGRAPLEGAHLALSANGWMERMVSTPSGSELTVLPNLRAVRRLHRRLNAAVLRGLGQRQSPRLGKGREFDRLREYGTGDDYRDIAWKASARHDKLIVREFRLDRSQDVLICVDRGHRMAAMTTRIRRVDHAVNAAVLVAYICGRMEDRVGVLSFGAKVESGVPQGRGAAHLSRVTSFAAGVEAEYIHTDYLALGAHVRRRMRTRSLVLIVTTLPETGEERALVRGVRMLAPTHLPLVVVLSDPALRAAAEAPPRSKEELCRSLVARELGAQRRRMMEDLRRLGAWVVDSGPEDAGLDAVNAYLEIKRRQLL